MSMAPRASSLVPAWRRHGVQASAALLALALAWLAKRHYSQASAEELRWILTPTTWLSSLLLGSFEWCPTEGYLSRQHAILISPACAGVNFLTIAFLSVALGFGGHFRTPRRAAAWLLCAIAVAYGATLLVNTARISLSVAVAHLAAHALGLTFHSVHRLLGIAVYLTGLLALCLTLQIWLSSRSERRLRPAGDGRVWLARSGSLLVALGCYVGITLVVPLLGGAAHNPEYWSHAVPVSVSVGGLIALVFAARGRSWNNGRHAVRSPKCLERFAEEPGSG